VYRLHYSYAEFSASQACMQVVDPRSLNFLPELASDDFWLEFDVQSVMTVMGVNYGLIDFEVLEEVPFTRGEVLINGTLQKYALYYNPRYPSMNSVTCFTNDNNATAEYDRVGLCALELGDTPVYPVMNHIGRRSENESEGMGVESVYCDCSEEVISNQALSAQCDAFLLMTGAFVCVSLSEKMTDC
jgi:hypothetical protein